MTTWLLIIHLWTGRIEAMNVYASEQACLTARHPMDIREGAATCEPKDK